MSGTIARFPTEIKRHIFSFLEDKDLARVQCVCKEWKKLAGDDRLWEALFIRMYKEPVPQGKLVIEAFRLKRAKIIGGEDALQNVVTTFLCTLKWNTKRRLECTFPNHPTYSMVIEQSFGPDRGTKMGIRSDRPEDETEYYKYIGNHSPGTDANLTFKASDQMIPHSLPICRSIVIITAEKKQLPYHAWNIVDVARMSDSCYFSADIRGIDVGYGNTLGYFSDINNWKRPFTLTCVQGNEGKPVWTGLIPYSQFKFVKIDSAGKIKWEKDIIETRNRSWGPRSWGRPYSFEEYLKAFPIEFKN